MSIRQKNVLKEMYFATLPSLPCTEYLSNFTLSSPEQGRLDAAV